MIDNQQGKYQDNLCTSRVLTGITQQWFIPYQADFYIPGYAGFGTRDTSLTPCINECVCRNSDHFNRHLNQRRQTIEQKMAGDLKALSLPEKRLAYLSLGAAGLLQELINIHIFLTQEFTNIKVVLVDKKFDRTPPKYPNPDSVFALPEEKFRLFVDFIGAMAKERGAQVSIQFLDRIQDVRDTEKFNIISAIDFDDFWKAYDDVCETYTHLAIGGRFYISAGMDDIIYDDKNCILSTIHNPPTLIMEHKEEKRLQNESKEESIDSCSPISTAPLILIQKRDNERVELHDEKMERKESVTARAKDSILPEEHIISIASDSTKKDTTVPDSVVIHINKSSRYSPTLFKQTADTTNPESIVSNQSRMQRQCCIIS